jgi:CheY-like chemotaxis protein
MSKKVIMLAYAHQDVVKVLRAELAKTQYALLHVTSPQEAIRCLKHVRANISLAIVDLDLSVTSGLDVIRRLGRCRHEKRPTIIATTTVDAPLLRHVVKRLGVETVVKLPIPGSLLRETINDVMAIRSQGRVPSATA